MGLNVPLRRDPGEDDSSSLEGSGERAEHEEQAERCQDPEEANRPGPRGLVPCEGEQKDEPMQDVGPGGWKGA